MSCYRFHWIIRRRDLDLSTMKDNAMKAVKEINANLSETLTESKYFKINFTVAVRVGTKWFLEIKWTEHLRNVSQSYSANCYVLPNVTLYIKGINFNSIKLNKKAL